MSALPQLSSLSTSPPLRLASEGLIRKATTPYYFVSCWRDPPWARLKAHDLYPWLVLAGVLDIALTLVLLELGCREANPIAAAVYAAFGPAGMIAWKALTLGFFVTLCEALGRSRPRVCRAIVLGGVVTTFCVTIWSGWLLATAGPVLGFLLGSTEPWFLIYRF
ncbi:MAG: DUF5658 family protein [Planctomycetota bacterium]